MSILDELIILIEDKKTVTLKEIYASTKNHSSQTVSSALGRLASKGFINKKKKNGKYHFSISQTGHKIIDRELDNIKFVHQKTYPETWQILVFNVPEKLRKRRDELREQLISCGFGRLHCGVWFSKMNQKNTIQKNIDELKLNDNVIFIQTKDFNKDENKKLVKKIKWDWKKINKQYSLFINKSKKYLNQKNKEIYKAKQLVYEFAKIIRLDPKLPNYLNIKNHKKEEAINLYKKIRTHCY